MDTSRWINTYSLNLFIIDTSLTDIWLGVWLCEGTPLRVLGSANRALIVCNLLITGMTVQYKMTLWQFGDTVLRKHCSSSHRGAHGSVVGWGTMLKAGKWQFRFSMRLLDFSTDLILPAALWALGSTQPLNRNWVPKMLLGGKGRPAHKADLTICEPIIKKKMWESRRLTTLWASMACYRASFTIFFLPSPSSK
jgi:hypothetical protein